MEAGFCGNNTNNDRNGVSYYSQLFSYGPRFSLRNLSSALVSSLRSTRFCDARLEDHQSYFLEFCFLCKKPRGDNRDIFMFRGDVLFYNEVCRKEQIEIDKAREKNRKMSSKALQNKKDKSK